MLDCTVTYRACHCEMSNSLITLYKWRKKRSSFTNKMEIPLCTRIERKQWMLYMIRNDITLIFYKKF